jgi:hypothetical protein
MKQFRKVKTKKPFNSYDSFYRQQFRKDLIDKLNVSSVHEVDFTCNLKFRGYLRYNAFDRNPLTFKQALAYQYIFESFFNQRVVFRFFQKKNIQRDQPADYFYKFKCNIDKRKNIFSFLSRLYINFYHYKLHGLLKKPFLQCNFDTNVVMLKNIKFYQAFWVKKFLDIDLSKEFYSLLQIHTNPLVFSFSSSRYQILSFMKIKESKLVQQNLLLPNYGRTKQIVRK